MKLKSIKAKLRNLRMKKFFSTIKLIVNTMANAGEVESKIYRVASRKADVK